jgi:multidrug efflux pump
MSTSLVAAFTPILLMGGMVGRLFREFAVTLSMAIGVSLLVSLTATPMMCAAIMKPKTRRGGFYNASERMFNGMRNGYDRSLSWALRHPRFMILLTALTVAVNIYLYTTVPKGFFPQQDTGRLTGGIQAAQDVSFQSMREKLAKVVEIVGKDPAVDTVIGFTGGGGGGGSTVNTGRMFIGLKDLDQRKITADEVIARMRGKLAQVPGAQAVLQPVQDIRVGGRISNAQFQYTIQGDNLKDLSVWASRVEREMRALPALADVTSDWQNKGLEARLTIDRDTASRLGITPQMIDDALYDAFGQRQVSINYTLLNQYHVVMEVAPRFWQHPETLKDIYVHTTGGGTVPLSAFTHYEPSSTSLAVNHQSQFPSVTVSFNLAPGISLGSAVTSVEAATRRMRMPSTIRGSFQGTAQAFQASLANQPLLILAALLTVYIVLGVLYESYIHPVTILSTLPSAGVGALLAMLLTKTEFTVISMIGIILLIGIVKKNAIMMIDFALEAERKEGKGPAEAIYEACLLRFRPIMMTTMAALLGALPLALGHGVGGELRRPLGISIVGGLIFSQLLTLYTTPVIYVYLDRLRLWFEGLRKIRGRRAETAPAPGYGN